MPADGDAIAKVLEMLCRLIVDDSDAVRVRKTESESTIIFEVDASDRDRGKLIGKGGATATAVRTLLKAVGRRIHRRLELNILEGNTRGPRP